jgi:hypothetical protein
VLVPGAITNISQAMEIKNPAEAARPPLGLTYAATGVFELKILSMISLIDESKPPGVFREMMTKLAFSLSALSMVSMMYSEVMGWMGASTVIFRIEESLTAGKTISMRRIDSPFFISVLIICSG